MRRECDTLAWRDGSAAQGQRRGRTGLSNAKRSVGRRLGVGGKVASGHARYDRVGPDVRERGCGGGKGLGERIAGLGAGYCSGEDRVDRAEDAGRIICGKGEGRRINGEADGLCGRTVVGRIGGSEGCVQRVGPGRQDGPSGWVIREASRNRGSCVQLGCAQCRSISYCCRRRPRDDWCGGGDHERDGLRR